MMEQERIHGRYTLGEQAGEGMTGPVYRAGDSHSGEQVVVKILRPQLFAEQPELVDRFCREAEALRHLNHPNIVHCSDFFEENGHYYLVMEYFEGGSLSDRLRREPIPLDSVLEIGLDLADALARAHRLGIIHRDVKPQNVLLAADGTPRLSDFGIAHFVRQQPLSVASLPANLPAGTLFYMPPEAFRGRAADERTDIWSLGVLLFEMVAGRLPFTGDTATEVIRQITREPLPDLRQWRPALPPALYDLLELMLQKEPEARIASVRLVGAALEAIRNGREATLPRHSQAAAPTPLPEPATSFIGRARELEEIVAIFREPGAQLLTLSGPGGVGKTRLALQVARKLLPEYADGVFFVDLAPVAAADLVPGRLARALNIREAGGRPLEDEIKSFLSGKQCLLLLDNFEQVIEAAPLVGTVHAAAPEVDILVTSREALQLSGEQEVRVRPLSLPTLSEAISPVALAQAEAVDLFVQRAAAAQPGLRLTAANARDVAEICVHLDGLPLAIELAAARTKILSPRYVRQQLGDRFGFLTGGPRDNVARHQTLRAAIDWSYDLLDEQEQTLFARLSVFQGGRSLEAIDAVCMPALSLSMIGGLESLVGKSLLRRERTDEDEPRFLFLETLHAYARDRLGESGEETLLRQRHTAYFATFAERVAPLLKGGQQERGLRQIRMEYDNLRAALTWALPDQDRLLGLRLVAALGEFWYYEGAVARAERWLERALPALAEAPPPLRVRLLNVAGQIAFSRGDHRQGPRWNEEALRIAREIGDRAGEAWALFWLSAHTTGVASRHESGLQLVEEALAGFREVDDKDGLAWAYNGVGELSRLLGRYEEARAAYLQALAIGRATGNTRREAIALVNLGYVAQHQGAYRQAEDYTLEGLAGLYHLGHRQHTTIALASLAGSLAGQGAFFQAARLLGAADAAFTRLDVPQQPADRMEVERYIALLKQQMDEADFNAAWAEGAAMTLDEAVASAFLKDRRR